MPRVGRGDGYRKPTVRKGTSTEEMDQVFAALTALLPRGREASFLQGLNQRIVIAIAGYSNSAVAEAESDDESEPGSDNIPVPHSMLGSRASMRRIPGSLPQQQGTQGKRRSSNVWCIPKPKPSTKTYRNHAENHRRGIRNRSPPSDREDQDSMEEFDSSSDGTEDSEFNDAHSSGYAPRHTGTTAKQRKRALSSHAVRRTTVADPTFIHPALTPIFQRSQIESASQLQIIVQRDAHNRTFYKCPKCPQTKQGRKVLEEHLTCHGARGLKCTQCDFATTKRASYNWHLKIHLDSSQRKKRVSRNKRQSPSESEISSPRMTRAKNNGPSGTPCVSRGFRSSGADYRAAVEPVLRAHPFSPGQVTSGDRARRRETDKQAIAEYKCTNCPAAFLFKSHLKLHRRHMHPARTQYRTDIQKPAFHNGKK